MILVDTSAWVEYLRATGSAVHVELRELIANVPLLEQDRDFDVIAAHTELRLHQPGG